MDDVMMFLGALIVAVGFGLIFMPLGVIVLGGGVAAAGYLEARKPKAPRQ